MDKQQQYRDLLAAMARVDLLRRSDPSFFQIRGHDYDAAIRQLDTLRANFASFAQKHESGDLADSDKPGMKTLASKARKATKRLNEVKRG